MAKIQKNKKCKNYALLFILLGMVALFFTVTIVKMKIAGNG